MHFPFVSVFCAAGFLLPTDMHTTDTLCPAFTSSSSSSCSCCCCCCLSLLLLVPAGVDVAAASSVPIVFGTAHLSLRLRANVQPGQTVLVLGASGGVGTAAVQVRGMEEGVWVVLGQRWGWGQVWVYVVVIWERKVCVVGDGGGGGHPPGGRGWGQASGLLLPCLRANVQPGQTVLVLGVSGGVGTAAVQVRGMEEGAWVVLGQRWGWAGVCLCCGDSGEGLVCVVCGGGGGGGGHRPGRRGVGVSRWH